MILADLFSVGGTVGASIQFLFGYLVVHATVLYYINFTKF